MAPLLIIHLDKYWDTLYWSNGSHWHHHCQHRPLGQACLWSYWTRFVLSPPIMNREELEQIMSDKVSDKLVRVVLCCCCMHACHSALSDIASSLNRSFLDMDASIPHEHSVGCRNVCSKPFHLLLTCSWFAFWCLILLYAHVLIKTPGHNYASYCIKHYH